VGLLVVGSLLLAWSAIHRISGFAPWLADSLRSVVGVDAVARIEEVAYGLEDRFYSVWRRGEKPRAYWVVPPESGPPAAGPNGVAPSSAAPSHAAPSLPAPSGPEPMAALPPPQPLSVDLEDVGVIPALPPLPSPEEVGVIPALPPLPVGLPAELPSEPELPAFRPHAVGPMHAEVEAPGDGRWVVLPEDAPLEDALMYKTLLHPDTERAWAELFVVALDLRRIRLHFVPGTQEPQPTVAGALELQRPGRVPDELHGAVIAAFNGGFKTEHGHYGSSVGGVTLVPPLEGTCTIVALKDDALRIGTWRKLAEQVQDATWWRQTPDCMYEDGKINPRLAGGYVRKWGSTLDGETVIRRSAIGVDAAGTTLFVGISNHTTAPAIARGMHHAGAATVAQLDINFSYPKFVTFRESRVSRLRVAVPLAEGFEYSEHEYLRKPSARDFFYVMDTSLDGRTARN
jgi:hypothetical protein